MDVCEISKPYLEGALSRFEVQPERKSKGIFYKISSPCTVPVDEQDLFLPEDGGQRRPPHLLKRSKKPGARVNGQRKKRAVKGEGRV